MSVTEISAGACLCGAVRFEVTGPIATVVHCHCTMCRRAHGAAFVSWAALPEAQVRVTAGEEQLARYRSSDSGTRSFCRTCASSMFCTLDTHPGTIDVALGCLGQGAPLAPQAHIFWDDRADWVEVGDGLPRLGGKTGLEPR